MEASDDFDFCFDILALKKFESAIRQMFGKRKGEWVSLNTLLEQNNLSSNLTGDISCCWVDPIHDDPGFNLVLFFDEESTEIASALYNKASLEN